MYWLGKYQTHAQLQENKVQLSPLLFWELNPGPCVWACESMRYNTETQPQPSCFIEILIILLSVTFGKSSLCLISWTSTNMMNGCSFFSILLVDWVIHQISSVFSRITCLWVVILFTLAPKGYLAVWHCLLYQTLGAVIVVICRCTDWLL